MNYLRGQVSRFNVVFFTNYIYFLDISREPLNTLLWVLQITVYCSKTAQTCRQWSWTCTGRPMCGVIAFRRLPHTSTNKPWWFMEADPSGRWAYLWRRGSPPAWSLCWAGISLSGDRIRGEWGGWGEDLLIDQQTLTEPHMQTRALSAGITHLTLLNSCPL